MKPEPLKKKGLDLTSYLIRDKDIMFHKKDIKSAVEWLKCELDCRLSHGASIVQCLEAVDMAFEDVTKK